MESIYVVEDERRKGHFNALFHETLRIAKERHVRYITLYVDDSN
jgi:ribosomal protein S18 acetylase RimI-like enzyme